MFKRVLTLLLALCICTGNIVWAQTTSRLAGLSQPLASVILKGMVLDKNDPFKFKFIFDDGNGVLPQGQFKKEAESIIRYFLAALAVPEDELWVNLSPYEGNRIIPQTLSQTDMGRALLEQDYFLKQLASSLTYPESEAGKRYWDAINNVGANNHSPVHQNFSKVWIVPDKAVVYQDDNRAFIGESRLKVMMEEDYVAQQRNYKSQITDYCPPRASLGGKLGNDRVGAALASAPNKRAQASSAPTEAFKQHILPSIEKDVNQGKNFSALRQVYHALILAAWFKGALKESIVNKLYVDQKKIKGIDFVDKVQIDKIYNEYIEAFRHGAYDYIKKEIAGTGTGSPARGSVYVPGIKIIKRRSYSGGFTAQHFSRDTLAKEPLAGAPEMTTAGAAQEVDWQAKPQTSQAIGGKKISEIVPIVEFGMNVSGHNDIDALVEEPLRAAAHACYDKNIITTSSSANRNDLRGIHRPNLFHDGKHYACLEIDYDNLSPENKLIARSLVPVVTGFVFVTSREGILLKDAGAWEQRLNPVSGLRAEARLDGIEFFFPIDENTTVDELSARAAALIDNLIPQEDLRLSQPLNNTDFDAVAERLEAFLSGGSLSSKEALAKREYRREGNRSYRTKEAYVEALRQRDEIKVKYAGKIAAIDRAKATPSIVDSSAASEIAVLATKGPIKPRVLKKIARKYGYGYDEATNSLLPPEQSNLGGMDLKESSKVVEVKGKKEIAIAWDANSAEKYRGFVGFGYEILLIKDIKDPAGLFKSAKE